MKRLIEAKKLTDDPSTWCEDCHDTGWTGDQKAGIRGNMEYVPCWCDLVLRAKRVLKRQEIEPLEKEP